MADASLGTKIEVYPASEDREERVRQQKELRQVLKEISVLKRKTDYLEDGRRNPSHKYMHMKDFSVLKASDTSWFSQGFYICPGTYKICLNVDANGYGDGKGTHVGVYVYMMAGDHDDKMKMAIPWKRHCRAV